MSEALKKKLQARELVFGSWVSFSHPSITEIFTAQGFDFHAYTPATEIAAMRHEVHDARLFAN